MTNLDDIARQLRQQGFRLTPLRRTLMEVLATSARPVSVAELLQQLAAKNESANKTTVYRELAFLQAQNLVKPIHYDEKEMRYEWAGEHHHHLVCRSCKTVEDVAVPALEKAVALAQKRVAARSRFSILDHSLEFFGLCKQCQ